MASGLFRIPMVLRHRVLGVAFLGMLVLALLGTYAVYNKTFVSVAHVTVEAPRSGLQLRPHADVKVRGVRVGEVRSISSAGHGAVLDVALNPDDLSMIPKDVRARILPKTLFGQKYVSLVIPPSPSSAPIAEGDVISNAHVSIEVQKVLSDSYPLLVAIQPVELSYTLNALATALQGRGNEIGNNLVRLDRYLKQINPLVPSIVDDLNLLTSVSRIYRSVLSRLAHVLDNAVVTGNTVVDKQRRLQALFTNVTALSNTARDFLQANGDNIIRLGKVAQPTLQLLARYAPEYPCLAKGISNWIPRGTEAFRNYTLHIKLEILPNQPTGYTEADDPVYGTTNPPSCAGLPNPPWSQANPAPQPTFDDGVQGVHGKGRVQPQVDLTSGYAGTKAEQKVVDSLAAPVMRVRADKVPDIATLLLGPIARGSRVSVR
ncbi:MAG: MCE family protein [Nocardioidaceae bacterium]